MTVKCVTGKRVYDSQLIAEDVLIELWTKNDYSPANAPKNVYRCDDCGYYHLTSSGEMNQRLTEYLQSPKYKINKEAARWSGKWR